MPRNLVFCVFLGLASFAQFAAAQSPVVPGSGTRIWYDDFENEEWAYIPNNPKASHEQDNQTRLPGGMSNNKMWGESSKRGHPDHIERFHTPQDGIPGSEGSLLLMTLQSNVPGRPNGKLGQDDLICRIPGSYSAGSYPNCVVRVYLQPFEKWEQYTAAASFGFRATVTGSRRKAGGGGLFSSSKTEREQSWPGIFIEHRVTEEGSRAFWVIRGSERGDYRGPEITETGWYTIGMSFTPDGRCHYYISEGVDNLTPQDLVGSHKPYNFTVESVQGMFFNIFNHDDGKSWSTPWIIDDPSFYVGRGGGRSR
ncbi:hypothetical protein [Blastopirellula marina]|uniref:Uncharacterized protein n=1 Tax=Blastopirellula marina DSM 3645 TaxID=314230 RepID=A3ZUP1_9BACT|nr:hypothetical protein [Blastopirellula marina]EAQ79627.1 hypothetical protein DSM3645_24000 [Blastopirellula marina DSM 3645]